MRKKQEIEQLLFGSLDAAIAPEPSQRFAQKKEKKKRRSASLQPRVTSDRAEALRREIAADTLLLQRQASTGDELTSRFVKHTKQTIVVTGATGTGKTQAVETFVKGSTRLKPSPTMGVERYDRGDLSIWDTSGDSRFEAATKGLLEVADAVVAFYDPKRPATFDLAAERIQNTSCGTLVATGLDDLEGRRLVDTLKDITFLCLVDPTDKHAVDALFATISSRLLKGGLLSPRTGSSIASPDAAGSSDGFFSPERQQQLLHKRRFDHNLVSQETTTTTTTTTTWEPSSADDDPRVLDIQYLAHHPALLDDLRSELIIVLLAFGLLALFSWARGYLGPPLLLLEES